MSEEHPKVLTINSGSSSIKFALYEITKDPKLIFSGKIDRIGLDNPAFMLTNAVNTSKKAVQILAPDFKKAAIFLIDWLEKQPGFHQIKCVGHRIVHGLNRRHSEIIEKALLQELDRISAYDPEHLPAEIELIRLFKKRYPRLLQVACFDTAFHATLPRVAKMLPIPRRFDKAGIQRYGFHGLSYAYLLEAFKKEAGEDAAKGRIILVHLGNGASLAAVKEGKCLDTSMGFTPTGGLMMGTRCGDLDPGVTWYLMKSEGIDAKKFNQLINQESGLLGVSEISSDMRDLLQQENAKESAAEAVALFCYYVKKWIGAFIAVLGGLDTLIFSGGIGENAPVIRARICEGLHYAGIDLDAEENRRNAALISIKRAPVKVHVIPTNEELMIAKDTIRLYDESKK